MEMSSPPWMMILRGVIGLLVGILAVIWPGPTLLWLIAVFAAYAVLGGIVSIVGAFQARRSERDWWIPMLLGIVSVVAGVYAIGFPGFTALVLVLAMGVNAIFTGVMDVTLALRSPMSGGQGLLLLTGLVSLLFGTIVIGSPGAGALALVFVFSVYAMVTGVMLVALGVRMQRFVHRRAMHAMPSG